MREFLSCPRQHCMDNIDLWFRFAMSMKIIGMTVCLWAKFFKYFNEFYFVHREGSSVLKSLYVQYKQQIWKLVKGGGGVWSVVGLIKTGWKIYSIEKLSMLAFFISCLISNNMKSSSMIAQLHENGWPKWNGRHLWRASKSTYYQRKLLFPYLIVDLSHDFPLFWCWNTKYDQN